MTHLSMDQDSTRRGDRSQLLGQKNEYDRVGGGDDDEDCENSQNQESNNFTQSDFISHFVRSSGPPQIVTLCILIALALGSTVGIVPAIVEDRYARLKHGYDGKAPCLELAMNERPRECLLGNEDAQNSAAVASFISNTLTFATSSMMGSISDEKGRRGIILIGIGLSLLAPLYLVLLQLFENIDPFPYYASHAISGAVNWMAVALSALSDVMPPMWRAPSFGLILAGFSLGFALSPILAVFMSHLAVSIFALVILIAGFIFACVSMPETLSPIMSERARLNRVAKMPSVETRAQLWKYYLLRPMKELLILNRNKLFRLLSALAFFSAIVSSADHTLFLYYVEENFGFNDKDIATLFLIMGLMGILVQAVILKPFNTLIGERRIIVVAFLVGALSNFLYGVAETKNTIFISATIASLTGMSFPTISAIKSNNVDELEQGRIQGALYSLTALASAIGPLMLRYIYSQTKDGGGFGKGTMFIFGSGLYLVATLCAWLLPEELANSHAKMRNSAKKRNSLLEQYGSTDTEDNISTDTEDNT